MGNFRKPYQPKYNYTNLRFGWHKSSCFIFLKKFQKSGHRTRNWSNPLFLLNLINILSLALMPLFQKTGAISFIAILQYVNYCDCRKQSTLLMYCILFVDPCQLFVDPIPFAYWYISRIIRQISRFALFLLEIFIYFWIAEPLIISLYIDVTRICELI